MPQGQAEERDVILARPIAWDDALGSESSITWLEPVDQLEYVRVIIVRNCKSPTGRLVPSSSGRVVGYSKLRDDARKDSVTRGYVRRVFYLKDSDVNPRVPGVPDSAVDPKTISPGVAGKRPQLPPAGSPDRVRGKDSPFENHVLDWLDDPNGSNEPQALIDTELAHDVPDGEPRGGAEQTDNSAYYGVLTPADGGTNIPLTKTKVTVGRMFECDIVLEGNDVSGLHCELTLEDGCWYVTDQHSSNGVKVNDEQIRVRERAPLEPGAILSIATTTLSPITSTSPPDSAWTSMAIRFRMNARGTAI
ncbi:MAG: FHA domain-containing protein [Planctomycetes bacterium]|nr:FHA domain-containing protein [Planctomycetota bacterium]